MHSPFLANIVQRRRLTGSSHACGFIANVGTTTDCRCRRNEQPEAIEIGSPGRNWKFLFYIMAYLKTNDHDENAEDDVECRECSEINSSKREMVSLHPRCCCQPIFHTYITSRDPKNMTCHEIMQGQLGLEGRENNRDNLLPEYVISIASPLLLHACFYGLWLLNYMVTKYHLHTRLWPQASEMLLQWMEDHSGLGLPDNERL